MKLVWLRCALVVLALWGSLLSGPATSRDWLYTVRSDDSLWSICTSYVERRLCFIELGTYNNLSKHDLIAPGSVLRIPYAWLKNPPEPAIVVYSRGDAQYIPAAEALKRARQQVSLTSSGLGMAAVAVSGQPLPADGRIFMGDRIITGDGNVRLEFGDGSEMVILPYSEVAFDRLSVRGDKQYVDTLMILKRGATTNRVTPSEGQQSRFRIRTPAGVAAVRGTEFRVSLEPENTSVMRSEVLKGDINVADLAARSQQAVAAGFGVRSEAGKPVPPPRKLLAAPVWQGDSEVSQAVPFSVTWESVQGADHYLLDLLDREGLIETRRVEGERVVFEELVDGDYRLRIRGVDEIGLQGLESERPLQVLTPLPVPAVDIASIEVPDPGSFKFTWDQIESASGYLVEVAADPEFSDLLTTEQVADPDFTWAANKPVYLRVKALFPDGRESDPSETIAWQPESDNSALLAGALFLLMILIAL